jgi:predicted SAM-dependent methyltransferase
MNIFPYIKQRSTLRALEFLLAFRALFFIGKRYTCPCCGWGIRAFTYGGFSIRERHLGYCPRCNSKARHRRDWLFLENETNLFSGPLRLLHVSPKYSLSRRFVKMPHIDYVAIDVVDRPYISMKSDLAAMPLTSNVFDAIICIHVLEHIHEDCQAINEMYRVLKPGGWAFISVPIRLDQKTYEDPTITSPEERELAFGEAQHVRFYGHDLADRLETAGFRVQLDLATNVDSQTREKYGLRLDENVFYCTKAIS